MYPIHVNLSGKRVIIAGGGSVASRKIKDLLNEEAILTVISPGAVNEIQEWHVEQKLTWIERELKREDLKEAFLIIAATNSKETNTWIASHAKPNQLVNVADQHELGNLILPSVIRRGRLVLSVSTGGASPSLSKTIKKELQQTYSEDYETYLDFLFECRAIIKKEFPEKCRRTLLSDLTDSRFLYDKEKQNVYKQALINQVGVIDRIKTNE